MSLNHRQLHRLRRIESGLLRSDPQLAAMLVTFSRLSAGEHLPSWEQFATRRDRIRQAAVLIVKAVTLLVAALVLLLDAVRGHRPPARSRPRPVQGCNPAQGS
jgi:hypothetical protein